VLHATGDGITARARVGAARKVGLIAVAGARCAFDPRLRSPAGAGAVTCVRALACALAIAIAATADAADPLAGVVLEDDAGQARKLDELAGTPVLVVVADRRAAEQANAWGSRLATGAPALGAWRAPGTVAWLSVIDGRGVPDYARDAARRTIRKRNADAERRARTSFLIDWDGVLAERLEATRGRALLVLLSRDHVPFARAGGEPADEDVAHLMEAITSVAR
jgi:hypothetical protein